MTLKLIVVDDHEAVLMGTVAQLQQQYPEAKIRTAQTAQQAQAELKLFQPDVIVMDLSIPDRPGHSAQTDTGLDLLRVIMADYPTQNIVVQSSHAKSVVRLKPLIHSHAGGFAVADKSLPIQDMLKKVDWALQGLMFTPQEMRTGLEVKPEWLEMLSLAFQAGLQDKAIAQQMHVSERTIRNYWTKVQDALGVYPDAGKNIRIQTEIRAREAGLID